MENSKNRLIKIAEAIVKVCRGAKIPVYSCRKSKHVYRQEQHVAIVCMMKYFRLHYRSVVQLLELMPSMRKAVGLARMPHYTTVQKFFRRFSSSKVEQMLRETVRLFGIRESVLAIDSTGFSSNASSRYYSMIRYRQSGRVWRDAYVKNAASVDTESQAIVSVMPKKVHTSDYMDLIPLAKRSSKVVKVGTVLADRGYDSESNNRFVRYDMKARNVIRVRTGTRCRKRNGRLRKESELSFDWETYLKRNVVEMVFSVIKRRFGDTLYSRSLRLQKKELKTMCIVYNLHRYVNAVSCSIFSYVFYRAV
ncbi:MAG: IS5 family transposase [Candidatus Altiarchaeota archaeon]|nr:IS5 family transposase [Candidatus Altiarchaeota archaeon]